MTMQDMISGLGLTDAQIAVKVCASVFSVTRWRKGRKVPTPAMRKALARLAGISVDDVTWERAAIRAALERETK